MKKTILAFFTILCFLFTVLMGLALTIEPVEASGSITINADGSVDPPSAPIESTDNFTYYLTDNIYDEVAVLRSNTTIDGAGYSLQGDGTGNGITLGWVTNVTIENVNIRMFWTGVQIGARNATIANSNISANTGYGVTLISSSDITIAKNSITANKGDGVYFSGSGSCSHNITIILNNISANNGSAINVEYSENNTIILNAINNNSLSGVHLTNSFNNIVAQNEINENCMAYDLSHGGIYLDHSSNNTLAQNNITGSLGVGLIIVESPYNTLKDNKVTDGWFNFGIWGKTLSDHVQDIDASNTLDGEPVYYWVNQRNASVPEDAGYVALVNCTRITVKNTSLTKNVHGIIVVHTQLSSITRNIIANNLFGISFYKSSNNTFTTNNVTNNFYGGIRLSNCSSNRITLNNLRGHKLASDIGMYVMYSANNIVTMNNIFDHDLSLGLYYSSSNTIFQNNFVNNTQRPSSISSTNSWNNSVEGNYWSDYTGIDSDHDGIGDGWYEMGGNNIDHYPLMGIFSRFDTSLDCDVNVISNSTLDQFRYLEENRTIKLYVSNTTSNQTFGFCRVSIPHALMDVSNISVIIDGGAVEVLHFNDTIYDNGTHRWIYFSYPHSTHEIDIIPEFPSLLILPLLLQATLLAVMAYRKKSKPDYNHSFFSGS